MVDLAATASRIGSGLQVLEILLVLCLATMDLTSAQFLVEVLEQTQFNNYRPVVRCDATGANFGEDVMAFSFGSNAIGCAIRAVPEMACEDVKMPKLNITGCDRNFAVVPRGNCSFSEKAFNVQEGRYEALIMYNEPGQAPIPMSGSKFAEMVQIPIVMVNYACMQSLMGNYSAEREFKVTLKASPGYYDLIKYLVPFVAIVGFCFVVLFISLVIRLCRERRRLARKRLSRSNLKKIPTKKYKKGDPEETCAICLEDFVDGDKLRVLPCRHAYHCKCVDPWLTKNRKVCPVCKRKVGPSNGSDSSDSDSERGVTAASTSVTPLQVTREQDPLLSNEQPMATNSSAEFPYPQTLPLSSSGSFSQATSLLNLSNLFHVGRLTSSRLAAAANRPTAPSPNPNNPSTSSREFLIGSVHSPQSSSVEQPEDRAKWAKNVRNTLAKWVQELSGRSSQPHVLLDDEEDTSTTVTREELESDAARRELWAENTGYDCQSASGNSLSTVLSAANNHAVAIDMEPADLKIAQSDVNTHSLAPV